MKTGHSLRWSVWLAVGAAAVGGAVHPAAAWNAAIYSWPTDGSGVVTYERAEDVRIRHVSAVLADFDPAHGFFDPAVDDTAYSLIKSENAIYVRFHANTEEPIPDGAVTVTAAYAEAAPGLALADLAGAVSSLTWTTIGDYVMDVEPLLGFPDEVLISGSAYPTAQEVGMPDRYRILCTVDCDPPLPTSFFLRVTLSADDDLSDNTAYSYYDQTGGAAPADVVILHDTSGSMSDELDWAKERAKMFVDLMNKGDRVGVVAFSTQYPGNTQIAATLNPIVSIDPSDPAKTFARAGIDSFSADGGTPMGSGVVTAQSVLNGVVTPSAHRAIVMLTDGKENRDPRVKDPPLFPLLDGPTGLNNDAHGAIALYPLWFGTLSHWGKTLLEDIIAVMDNGKVVDQPDDDLKLAEAYLMIRGILTSDDVYDIHRGTAGDGYESLVDIDPVTNELILTTAWQSFGRDLDISVMVPGSAAWQPAGDLATSTSRGQLYVVHRFVDPAPGSWRYRLAPAPEGELYVLAALADKVEILMQSWIADAAVAAGEPVVIEAKLTRRGEGVAGAVVEATVGVPERSLGTLLHEYRDRLQVPVQASPCSDVGRAKGVMESLRKLVGSEKILSYGTRTMALTDPDGDGTYTGRFDATQVAGTYRVTITATGPSSSLGEGFRRQHQHAAVVSLGPLDVAGSIVEVTRLDPIGDAVLRAVTVIPVDRFGNFADPGYGGSIQIDASNGQWQGPLVDLDDGSYTRVLQLGPGESAEITVSAFGQKLPPRDAEGQKVSTKGWRLGLYSGTVRSTGALNQLVDQGASYSLGLGYRWQPRWTALFLVGGHEFSGDSGVETVLQASANLRVQLSQRLPYPYVRGGLGAYRTFDDDWHLGVNTGFGLTYPASPRIDLEGGADYHNVFRSTVDLEFWQVYLGFSIGF